MLEWSAADYTAPLSQYWGLHVNLIVEVNPEGQAGSCTITQMQNKYSDLYKTGYLAFCLQLPSNVVL